MILTIALTHLRGATPMVIEDPHTWTVGSPLEADLLIASFVVDKTSSVSSLAEILLRRAANSFSFELQSVFQDGGDLAPPQLFRR